MSKNGKSGAVQERQRGQRPQTDEEPKTQRVIEDVIISDEDDDEEEPEISYVTTEVPKVSTKFLENSPVQRHGQIEQRKMQGGRIQIRCQCGTVFRGKNFEKAERMFIDHAREFDPDIPDPDNE